MTDADILERFTEFAAGHGLRMTKQREAIVHAAFSTTEHYTAEDLLVMARAIDTSVSRATVYRTLPILVESGLLKEMDFGRDQKYYDPNFIDHPDHNHLICIDCDKIVEFEDPRLEEIQNRVAFGMGFLPTMRHTHIEARCNQFKRLGTCKNLTGKSQRP